MMHALCAYLFVLLGFQIKFGMTVLIEQGYWLRFLMVTGKTFSPLRMPFKPLAIMFCVASR
jgi:hypothetical protein